MTLFAHLIYEYKKGVRDLCIHTCHVSFKDAVEKKLKHFKIDYILQFVNEDKMNVFFGKSACVAVIHRFGDKLLSDYTAEEDFILGIMLGYSREKQCERYLSLEHACKSSVSKALKSDQVKVGCYA